VAEGRPAGPRRVLHVIDSLGFGGAQAILKNYLESRAGGEEVHLFSLRRAPNPVPIVHGNVAVAASSSRFSPRPMLQLRRIVLRERIEVLHCHLFRAQVFGFALKRLFFPGITLVFHEHGRVVGREGESWLEAWAFRVFLHVAASHVDRFVCISDLTREALFAIIGDVRERAVVVHNPIQSASHPDEIDRVVMRRQLSVPHRAFAVGFAARMVERKGWREFLGAIERVAAVTPTYFLLAGDGEDRDKVAAHIRERGLASTGRLLSHVGEMSQFYPALDCFVAPPHWEPHGLSHLEAQSYGVPIVVSNVPGLNGTVHAELDALLCPAKDASGLAEQILRIAQDPELRQCLAERGRANAEEYTIDAFASALERVYAGTVRTDTTLPAAHAAGSPATNASKRFPY
jgi:glycosyltransferase involved in cell wall biosynthesis